MRRTILLLCSYARARGMGKKEAGVRRVVGVLAVLGSLLTACGVGQADSEAEPTERYRKSLANQEAVEQILKDPESYGSEDEIVELLASYATEDAVMDDAVFGAAPIQKAWHKTLYGKAMDAQIDSYYWWVSEDGSQGGVLWMWHGTNLAGNPFELPGISLNEYDDEGLLTYQYIVYPYPDEYVNEAITGSGT